VVQVDMVHIIIIFRDPLRSLSEEGEVKLGIYFNLRSLFLLMSCSLAQLN